MDVLRLGRDNSAIWRRRERKTNDEVHATRRGQICESQYGILCLTEVGGGREGDRTPDPLLAKQNCRLYQARSLIRFLMFSTLWGICFPLEANPNALKT